MPPDFVCFGVDISGGIVTREIRAEDLPDNWHRHPAPRELRDLGTRWAEAGETAVLRVPSAVVPGERNYLLNPRHADFGRLAIGPPEPFALDSRLLHGSSPVLPPPDPD